MNNQPPPTWVTDIDDTIADTALTLSGQILREFPHSSFKPALELIKKYDQPGNVPQWQAQKIQARITHYFNHPHFLLSLPPIPRAASIMTQITNHTPLKFYLTSRPPTLHAITLRWLKKNHFPSAPIITRPPEMKKVDWKLRYLRHHFPNFSYFVEDNFKAIDQPVTKLSGLIILFDRHHQYRPSSLPPNVIGVHDWPAIAHLLLRT